jgi:hypothetical protein
LAIFVKPLPLVCKSIFLPSQLAVSGKVNVVHSKIVRVNAT